jgi:hypothetical protein
MVLETAMHQEVVSEFFEGLRNFQALLLETLGATITSFTCLKLIANDSRMTLFGHATKSSIATTILDGVRRILAHRRHGRFL